MAGTSLGAKLAWERRRQTYGQRGFARHWTELPNAGDIRYKQSLAITAAHARRSPASRKAASRQAAKTRQANGYTTSWNKGLTTTTSTIVAAAARKAAETQRKQGKYPRIWKGKTVENCPAFRALIEKGKHTKLLRYGNLFGPTLGWSRGKTAKDDPAVRNRTQRSLETRLRKYGTRFGRIVKTLTNTAIERKLALALSNRDVRFHTQTPLCGTIVDFVLPERKIVVFADGCHWHCCNDTNCTDRHSKVDCKRCKTVTAEIVRQKDQMINQRLTKAGWTIFRFWEHAINSSPDACVDQILTRRAATASIT